MFKKLVKTLLRLPADALLASSGTLARRIDAGSNHAILGTPNLTAKFFPYKPDDASYLIPNLNRDRKPGKDLSVPPKELRVHGYLDSEADYVAAGKKYTDTMTNILAAAGVSILPHNRLLDFGCGDGMMLRHFDQVAAAGEAWGLDLNGTLMMWCQQHLSPPFKFATSTSFPHLPFEDGYFDLIYAFSVFTHICDLAEAWLLELKRIVRPGGILYLTVHDKHSIDLLFNKYTDNELSQQLQLTARSFSDSDFSMFTLNRVPGGGIENEGRMAQVFYDIDYLTAHWQAYMDVIRVQQEAYGCQTAVVLRKR
jgi:SAM-dependent methyltransferase